MVLLLVFIIGIVTATNLVVIYKLTTKQNDLKRSIENKRDNNFYLCVKKSNEKELQDNDNSIIELSDSTIATKEYSPMTYVQKTISAIIDPQDTREKMIVQLMVKEWESPNLYHNVKQTFILRKDMDIDEIIECIGEPEDIEYDNIYTDMIYKGPEGNVQLILFGGKLLKIEK